MNDKLVEGLSLFVIWREDNRALHVFMLNDE